MAALLLVAPRPVGTPGDRLAVVSSRTGQVVRWLTSASGGVTHVPLSVRGGSVYFVRYPGPSIWRVRVTGGAAQLVQAGASDYAVSPNGRDVASAVSVDHGNVLELAVRNLVTGKRNTIVMATKPAPGANNWPPNISGLTWAPDNTHLAVQLSPTAAINTVLVFNAFTAKTASEGATAPTPCPAAYHQRCGVSDPAYLASGALTYIIERQAQSGAANVSLVSWQAGHLKTLVGLPAAAAQSYGMTAQEQAIWGLPPATKPFWTIWRWSGGAAVKIAALSSRYGVDGAIAW